MPRISISTLMERFGNFIAARWLRGGEALSQMAIARFESTIKDARQRQDVLRARLDSLALQSQPPKTTTPPCEAKHA